MSSSEGGNDDLVMEVEDESFQQQDAAPVSVNRTTFDAACVFAAATLFQVIVPSPLDHFLFPAAAAVWFVQTKQDPWMIDYAYQHAHRVKALTVQAKNLAIDFVRKQRNPDDNQLKIEEE